MHEVKGLRDKSLALERYAAQANNVEAERKAVEIRLRAERKCGQLLKETTKAKGTRGNIREVVTGSRTTRPPEKTLKDMGISRDLSSKFQKLVTMVVRHDHCHYVHFRE